MVKQPDSGGVPSKPDARQNQRYRIPLDVRVVAASGQSFPARVRNISASGAFVHAAGVALDVGATVEFVLPCRRDGQRSELRISATVTRLEPDGVALRFGRYDSVGYTELIEAIYNLDRVA